MGSYQSTDVRISTAYLEERFKYLPMTVNMDAIFRVADRERMGWNY